MNAGESQEALVVGENTRKILNLVYPDLKVRIIKLYEDMNSGLRLPMMSTSGMRNYEVQKALWQLGRDESGHIVDEKKVVTFAEPGHSCHNFGLAVDSCFRSSDPFLKDLEKKDPKSAKHIWEHFGELAEAHGLTWGGRFRHLLDLAHTEVTYGLRVDEIRHLYSTGGIRGVWTKLDQIRGVRVGSEWESILAH